jgi:hypothetical protein
VRRESVFLAVLYCMVVGPTEAQTPGAAAAVDEYMSAWQDCSERRLPSLSYIGACAEPLPALYESRDGQSYSGGSFGCSVLFDGNVSTFVEDIVLSTERKLFGTAQTSLAGNQNSTHVGINLHGHFVHLTGVSIIPRAPHTDWQARKHPYSPNSQQTNWTMTISGARIQGSHDLSTWTDLYTFSGALAPHPAATSFNFEQMTNGSCAPYSAFRLLQPRVHSRVYFTNSDLGPIEMNESFGLASMAELSFVGVRSLGTQCTGFASTKVQILTQKVAQRYKY